MGRVLRRVPVDFDWPIGQVWAGFICPYRGVKCSACDGLGYSKSWRDLRDAWYGNADGHEFNYGGEGWCRHLTQDEVDHLVEKGRFRLEIKHGQLPESPTAEDVNAFARDSALAHDAINQMFCVDVRAKSMGIYDDRLCKACGGECEFYYSEEIKRLVEGWREDGDGHKDPPDGEGWQVWENVSEGSPITPVFATGDELIEHLATHGTEWRDPWSREAAQNFVMQSGWAPSGIIDGEEYGPGYEKMARVRKGDT